MERVGRAKPRENAGEQQSFCSIPHTFSYALTSSVPKELLGELYKPYEMVKRNSNDYWQCGSGGGGAASGKVETTFATKL